MSNPWMIASIIEGIVIVMGIWYGIRFRWNEGKRQRREQGVYWPQVSATVLKEPFTFLGFHRIVAAYDSSETGYSYTFKEWHHLDENEKPAAGDPILVRVNFPVNPDEHCMDIEESW